MVGLGSFRTWGHSSAGRAVALQASGRRFDPVWLHHPDFGRAFQHHSCERRKTSFRAGFIQPDCCGSICSQDVDIVKGDTPGARPTSAPPESIRAARFECGGTGAVESGYGAGYILMKFWSFSNVHPSRVYGCLILLLRRQGSAASTGWALLMRAIK